MENDHEIISSCCAGKGPFQWKTVPQGAATSVWALVWRRLTKWWPILRELPRCMTVADEATITAVSEAYGICTRCKNRRGRSGKERRKWLESRFTFLNYC